MANELSNNILVFFSICTFLNVFSNNTCFWLLLAMCFFKLSHCLPTLLWGTKDLHSQTWYVPHKHTPRLQTSWQESGYGWNCLCLCFFSPWVLGILGPKWQKTRGHHKKVSTDGEGLRRSCTGDMGWNLVVVCFIGFVHFWLTVTSCRRADGCSYHKGNKNKCFYNIHVSTPHAYPF